MKQIVALIVLAVASSGTLFAMECKVEAPEQARRLTPKPRRFKFDTADLKDVRAEALRVSIAQKLSPESCAMLYQVLVQHGGIDMDKVLMSYDALTGAAATDENVATILDVIKQKRRVLLYVVVDASVTTLAKAQERYPFLVKLVDGIELLFPREAVIASFFNDQLASDSKIVFSYTDSMAAIVLAHEGSGDKLALFDLELFCQKAATITADQATALLNAIEVLSEDSDAANKVVFAELNTYLQEIIKI